MHGARVAGGQIGRGGRQMLDDGVCSQWALATLVLTNLVECGSAVSIGLHQGVSWEENARRKQMQAHSWACRHT